MKKVIVIVQKNQNVVDGGELRKIKAKVRGVVGECNIHLLANEPIEEMLEESEKLEYDLMVVFSTKDENYTVSAHIIPELSDLIFSQSIEKIILN